MEALKGRNKQRAAVRLARDHRRVAENAISPFQGLRLTVSLLTLGVAQGCVSSPLWGSFWHHYCQHPGVQQEMWDTHPCPGPEEASE
jgi:hypothetical protein